MTQPASVGNSVRGQVVTAAVARAGPGPVLRSRAGFLAVRGDLSPRLAAGINPAFLPQRESLAALMTALARSVRREDLATAARAEQARAEPALEQAHS